MSVQGPKCERSCEAVGVVESDEPALAGEVYQCPACVRHVEMGGETVELALVFMLADRVRPFHPADPDADLSWD